MIVKMICGDNMKHFTRGFFLFCLLLLLPACFGGGEGSENLTSQTLSGGETASRSYEPLETSEVLSKSGEEDEPVGADPYRIRDFCFFDASHLLLELESLSDQTIGYGWISTDGELSYENIRDVVYTGKTRNMYGVPFFYDGENALLFTGDAVYKAQMGNLESILEIPPAYQRDIRYNGAQKKCVFVDNDTFEVKVLDIETQKTAILDRPQENPGGDEWHPYSVYHMLSNTKDDFVFYWSVFEDRTAQLRCCTLQGRQLYAISSYPAPYPLTYRIDCLEEGFVFRCAQEYEQDGAILGQTQLDFYDDTGKLLGQWQLAVKIEEMVYLEDQGKAVASISKAPEDPAPKDPAEIFSYEILFLDLDTMAYETVVKDRLVRKIVVSPDNTVVFWRGDEFQIHSAPLPGREG